MEHTVSPLLCEPPLPPPVQHPHNLSGCVAATDLIWTQPKNSLFKQYANLSFHFGPSEHLSPVSDCIRRGRWWEAAKCWKTLQGRTSPERWRREVRIFRSQMCRLKSLWDESDTLITSPLLPPPNRPSVQPLAFLSISSSWTWWPLPRLTSPFSVYS